ncbi:protein FAM3C-like isoform X2 [Parambassis ranga]|nr:protein FAM3C-like isoform X2 [Parambassis ranga]
MRRANLSRCLWQALMALVLLVIFFTVFMQQGNPFTAEWRRAVLKGADISNQASKTSTKAAAGPCVKTRDCPEDHFSFYIQSGAANVVAPKICIQNKLVLGALLNNAGVGINVVILNAKTGEVVKTAHFDMYSGDVNPLIKLLKSVEKGSAVLMASYDEPSSKLNEDAKKLIAELGSSAVHLLGFRDNWVFVGGKAAAVKSKFEKVLKNDHANNKYENWPELIDLEGCIPKYME